MYKTTFVSIRCSNRATIPESADVERYGISSYMIWLDSVYGCPKGTECGAEAMCRVPPEQRRNDLQRPRNLHVRRQCGAESLLLQHGLQERELRPERGLVDDELRDGAGHRGRRDDSRNDVRVSERDEA